MTSYLSGKAATSVQQPRGFGDALVRYAELLRQNPTKPLVELLPLIFRLKGKPFSIAEGHFLQEPMYRIAGLVPRRTIVKAGRQVSKSTGLAASGILRAATIPYFNLLTVTPLFEQVRRFSSNYVKPFLSESYVSTQLIRRGTDNSVLQRTLANGSNLFYNYASNSADRIRGTPSDQVDLDEMQDFDLDVIPVIESCLDASPHKLLRLSGTPKTFDGPLQVNWEQSSQGIWHIPCQRTGCKHVNNCSVEGDILKMIDNTVTLVCAKCGKPVDSSLGYFVHVFPERQLDFVGYHLPQVAFPMHYADPVAWHKIQDALKHRPRFYVYNEILGESLDVGLKLLTKEDLVKAGQITMREPAEHAPANYLMNAIGVDWGGKGKERTTDKEEFISNTALAIAGMRSDGKIEVTWVKKTPYEADHFTEAAMVKDAASKAHVDYVAHDFGGAGDVRESILIRLGVPGDRIAPMTYARMSVNKPIVYYEPPGMRGVRHSYILDKSRSLQLLCALIKTQQILLPRWDDASDCLNDFLSIFEEQTDGPRGSPVRLVKRLYRRTDDIVNAVNYACMALYHATGKWPDLAAAYMRLDGEDENWTPEDF